MSSRIASKTNFYETQHFLRLTPRRNTLFRSSRLHYLTFNFGRLVLEFSYLQLWTAKLDCLRVNIVNSFYKEHQLCSCRQGIIWEKQYLRNRENIYPVLPSSHTS